MNWAYSEARCGWLREDGAFVAVWEVVKAPHPTLWGLWLSHLLERQGKHG